MYVFLLLLLPDVVVAVLGTRCYWTRLGIRYTSTPVLVFPSVNNCLKHCYCYQLTKKLMQSCQCQCSIDMF
jgi:hypothetical protein